jgi:bifunctional polynucleotide phosphatase/kinase
LFHFTTPVDLAQHNELYRVLYAPKDDPPHAAVPPLAFAQWRQAYEAPVEKEGFEELRQVNFVWQGDDVQKKLWNRYLVAVR